MAEVVTGSPFDRADSQLTAGDVITSVNGTVITPETDFTSLLNGLSGKLFLREDIKSNATKSEQSLTPIIRGKMQD
ncbi:MAG: hypothetical protein K2K52_09245, partial [Paramuribaculum sp.]|nr:hypothetical protein [Paramuribaculum sp.]